MIQKIKNIGLTGSADGLKLVLLCPELIEKVYQLKRDTQKTIAKDALLGILNISAEMDGAALLLSKVKHLFCIYNLNKNLNVQTLHLDSIHTI